MNKAQILHQLGEQLDLIDQVNEDPSLSNHIKSKHSYQKAGYLHAMKLIQELPSQTRETFPLQIIQDRIIEDGILYIKRKEIPISLEGVFTTDHLVFTNKPIPKRKRKKPITTTKRKKKQWIRMNFVICDFRDGMYITYQNKDETQALQKIHITP